MKQTNSSKQKLEENKKTAEVSFLKTHLFKYEEIKQIN